ncbi:MAG: NUDIX hydrolase [Clostridia bacterium]|nr:NUDIX hydrolase [Clostridia bacterium]
MSKYKPSCEEEKIFLEKYDAKDYPSIAITVDAVVFGVRRDATENYRKLDKQTIQVLLVKREEYPYKNYYALPGGFVGIEESLEDTLERTLKNKTGLTGIYSEQLYTFGAIDRDPRMRIVSSAYISLLDANKTNLKDAIWVPIDALDKYDIAFDHKDIIDEAMNRLRGKIVESDIVFHMMPEEFTISELQEVYEIVLGEKLLAPAFRRVIAKKIEDTGKMTNNAGHRPSRIFRQKKD